jgi:hypothetical protein
MKKLIKKWLFSKEFEALESKLASVTAERDGLVKYAEIGKKACILRDKGYRMPWGKLYPSNLCFKIAEREISVKAALLKFIDEINNNYYCSLFGDTRTTHEKIEDMKQSAIKSGIQHKGHGRTYRPKNFLNDLPSNRTT